MNNKNIFSVLSALRQKNTRAIAGILAAGVVALFACKAEGELYGEKENSLPTLTTINATNITATTATLGGNITSTGVPAYTEKGICIATTRNPTTSSGTKLDFKGSGKGTGNYTIDVINMQPSTTYYVRAYAINSSGTAYGNEINLKTEKGTQVRFKKEYAEGWVTEMTVDIEDGEELASYYFGEAAGTSPYYEIIPGNHVPYYYYARPDPEYEGYYYCLPNPYTYNFQAGRKYTVVCSDAGGGYFAFSVTNDGTF